MSRHWYAGVEKITFQNSSETCFTTNASTGPLLSASRYPFIDYVGTFFFDHIVVCPLAYAYGSYLKWLIQVEELKNEKQ